MARVPWRVGITVAVPSGEESPQYFVCQVKECGLESEDQRFTDGYQGQFTFYMVR